jgi:hypothetical protein
MRGEEDEEEERILSPLFFLPFPSISPLSSLENLDPATLETSPPSASPSPFSPLRLSLPFLPPPPNQKKRPKVIIVEDKKWGPAERDALYKGLETFGVGGWRSMVDALLPRWDETALRVKAGRLMGTQSLARYVGWKGDKEAVDAEFTANRELGEATGCWKGGVLVEDDAGSVAAELARRAAAAAK